MFTPAFRRLSAFTLLELVVVLVVSALLFRLAYAALGLVQQQQRIFERRSATLGQLSTWQNTLSADMQQARRVVATADQLHCQLPDREVVYSWPDSILTRQQGELTDSLVVPVRLVTTYWEGKPRTQGLVEEASFLLVAEGDTFYLQAAARYAAQQLLTDSIPTPTP